MVGAVNRGAGSALFGATDGGTNGLQGAGMWSDSLLWRMFNIADFSVHTVNNLLRTVRLCMFLLLNTTLSPDPHEQGGGP